MAWRISDRATFEALGRSRSRARRGPVTVTFAPAGEAPRARVAYAVGRHVGTAVVRNRVRRRLRAAVDQVGTAPPGAYLVAAAPAAKELEFEQLRSYVDEAMTAASGLGDRGGR